MSDFNIFLVCAAVVLAYAFGIGVYAAATGDDHDDPRTVFWLLMIPVHLGEVAVGVPRRLGSALGRLRDRVRSDKSEGLPKAKVVSK